MKKLLTALIGLLLLGSLPASLNVLEKTENHLLLEYRLDDYTLSLQDELLRIDAANMGYNTQIGAPLIPYSEARVGVPPQGSVTVTVISSSTTSRNLEHRLVPVPKVVGNEQMSEHRYVIDENLYTPDTSPLVKTLDTSHFRGLSYIPLEFHPFTYDGRYTLQVTGQALIRIDIDGNVGFRSPLESDELSDLLLSQLINPEQTRNWQSKLRSEVNYADFGKSDFWLRLETSQEGMYKITPSQMTGFNLADIDPRSFRMFSTEGKLLPFTIVNPGYAFTEVPIHVEGEADESFDSGDYIVFYGTTRDGVSKNQSLQSNPTYYNPYSGNTVYWLTHSGEFSAPPLRITTTAPQPTWQNETSVFNNQARLETESQRREIQGFDWYMTNMFGSLTAEYQYSLELSDVNASLPQALSFLIRQEDVGTSIWHNISVYVNNIPVVADTSGSIIFRWRGTGEYVFYKEVNSFVSGTNQIRIKVIRTTTDNLYLNWITVDYSRQIHKGSGQLVVNQMSLNYGLPIRNNLTGGSNALIYQIDSFNQVKRIPLQTDSGQFFVASGTSLTKYILSTEAELRTPVNISNIVPRDLTANPTQVDNVIITADEYATPAQSLADKYFQTLGKRSMVVKQSDIFNQFNGGHPDPAALRQFLRYVYFNYPTPSLTSVTLIGLGTIDWRNFSGQANAKNKIIVYQRSQIASDDYFVMLTQAAHPELAIGRYPVNKTSELNNMLSNFQNYTQNPQGGWWRNSMVMLGDDLFNGSQTSYENLHTRQTQDAANIVHPSILVDKIFAWEYGYDEFQNKPGARDDMISAINEGRLVWYYIGHGSFDKLGAEDYFNGASDMGRFNNANKLPFFMAASCSVSKFDYWGYESLGQKTVLLNNLGAIASYSATRLSAPYNNAPMMLFLLNNLANGRNPVGYSIMSAKIQYTQSNDNDATYVFLGDPLLKIIPPLRDSVMVVSGSSSQGNEETFFAREQITVNGGFSPSSISGIGEIKVFNTEPEYSLDWQTLVSHRGTPLFKGSTTVTAGEYTSQFILPDDVVTGNTGLIVSYLWDPASKQDYVNYLHPFPLSDQAVIADNPDAPTIELFLGSMDFRAGDTVGINPTLYAKISDSNGINVTGSSGHNIFVILDNALQPIPVNNYFSYNLDSHTSGLLTYNFSGLSEGPHSLQLIAFDNFNMPSVASTTFIVKKSGDLAIERFLIYPNPMKHSTSFTFTLSDDSDLIIDIFSPSGKKIHSFTALGKQGFNSIAWNGKDNRGDRFANNTYFVKIRANSNGKKAEKTEKLVIYN